MKNIRYILGIMNHEAKLLVFNEFFIFCLFMIGIISSLNTVSDIMLVTMLLFNGMLLIQKCNNPRFGHGRKYFWMRQVLLIGMPSLTLIIYLIKYYAL